MDSIELARIERRMRRVYELSRLRGALLGIAPVLLIVAGAACFGQRQASVLSFGLAVVAVGTAMLWYGRDPQKAVLPGIAAGVIPLSFSLCANHIHMCGPEGCSSLCVPACIVGGVVAGLVIAAVGNRRRLGAWFWLSASSLALLTGAMGCACIGYSGVVGLGLGFGAGLVPGLVRRVLGPHGGLTRRG
jgi:hypothetical protein